MQFYEESDDQTQIHKPGSEDRGPPGTVAKTEIGSTAASRGIKEENMILTQEQIDRIRGPKRRPGLPPKIRTEEQETQMPKKYIPKLLSQEQIDKLKGRAKENAQRNRGLAVEEELKTLIPILAKEVKNFPELEYNESCIVPPWIDEGRQIIRNAAWAKTPLDFAEEDEDEDEDELQNWSSPFAERIFADCFIDSLAGEFARRTKQHHLTSPDLVSFVVRVLEAALWFGRDLHAAFQQKEEIAVYLDELRNGSGTFREPPKPKGRPGPKPRPAAVVEHAGPNAYISPEEAARVIPEANPWA